MNQNPDLTIIQVLLLRYHNVCAREMAELNPQWDDETLFQECRRINIAVQQNINYYEYLVKFIGEKNMLAYNLIYPRGPNNKIEYVNDYNKTINPAILNEYASAAFRMFHTFIYGHLESMNDEGRCTTDVFRLSDWYDRPKVIVPNFKNLLVGMSSQAADASDRYYDSEITSFLFRYNKKFGKDLRAIDIQRGRDHGLPSFVEARKALGLSVPENMEDLRYIMPEEVVDILKKLYENVKDIDLAVGGSLENNAEGALTGPTFLRILLQQFYRTRVGDRFFFENKGALFTLEQLQTISNTTIASVICATTNIKRMQPSAFELISESNALVPCSEIPKINYTLWKE